MTRPKDCPPTQPLAPQMSGNNNIVDDGGADDAAEDTGYQVIHPVNAAAVVDGVVHAASHRFCVPV